MRSTICTLFEGDYHYGLGALVNSLHRHGYRGVVWAGYRGTLPPWAVPISNHSDFCEYAVGDGCTIRFVRVRTERHLTNQKPDFMLDLWQQRCPDVEKLFYFDPDIVIKCTWAFFEEWVGYGVAVCEDVNSPLPSSHPIRHCWRRFCAANDIALPRVLDAYVSGGFVGMHSKHISMLKTWQKLIAALQDETGDLRHIGYRERPYAFYNGDQDVLNMTLMSSDEPLSLIGREGMDFVPGGYTMSHAAGDVKPWRKAMLRSAIRGIPPRSSDKAYWQNVMHPISLYSKLTLLLHRCDLSIGSAVGLIVRRA